MSPDHAILRMRGYTYFPSGTVLYCVIAVTLALVMSTRNICKVYVGWRFNLSRKPR